MAGPRPQTVKVLEPKPSNGLECRLLILGRLPIDRLPIDKQAGLRGDALPGLTVAALPIPEGMAYAQLAELPPQTAFYSDPAELVLYAILGTSRQLVIGVSAAVSMMNAV